MLQSQINYWDLQETIRHNRATEEAGFQQARASEISANASRLQAEVAERTLPIKEREAQASLSQAEAALQNAATNRGNLDVNRMNAYTNRGNLDVNRMNAYTNRYNADINQQNANTNVRNASINQQNADTNRWNAAINEMNAVTNQRNAATNEWNARINEYNAVTNRVGTMSQVALNETTGVKNLAEAGLTTAKIPEQNEKNYQATISSKYANTEHLFGVIESGTHSFNNVGSGLGSLLRGAGTLINSVSNVTSSAGNNQGNSLHDKFENVVLNVTGIKPAVNLANYAKNKNLQALEKFGLSVLGGVE